eukprot:gene17480-biopygen8943
MGTLARAMDREDCETSEHGVGIRDDAETETGWQGDHRLLVIALPPLFSEINCLGCIFPHAAYSRHDAVPFTNLQGSERAAIQVTLSDALRSGQ